jgi:hypothetical protein
VRASKAIRSSSPGIAVATPKLAVIGMLRSLDVQREAQVLASCGYMTARGASVPYWTLTEAKVSQFLQEIVALLN